jgi:hypothetical protein
VADGIDREVPVRRERSAAARPIPQTYRVTAVRHPPPVDEPAAAARAGPQAAALPVSDEEIVHALLTRHDDFETRLLTHARERPETAGVKDVELRDVRPASSVLLDLLYHVEAAGSALDAVGAMTGAVILAVAERLEEALGGQVSVAAVPMTAAAAVAAAPAAAPASGWDRLAPVLATIGTGIGIIGFVVFVGGLIVWGRLNGAGFPAAPALSVFPKQDLLVIGAQTLVPQVLVALASVLVLSVIYLIVRNWSSRVGEAEAVLLAGQSTKLSAIGMFLFVFFTLLATVLIFKGDLDGAELWYALLGVVVGAVIAATVSSVTHRFVYLATTSFVLVGVLMSFLAYWRARDDKQVRGAALIRTDHTAVRGLFLTEGAGRVYLAEVKLDDDDQIIDRFSRIIGIDKAQVSDLAIAGAKPVDKALADARGLARELCSRQSPPTSPPKPGACPAVHPLRISPYSGGLLTVSSGGAVVVELPSLEQDAKGTVTFVTRERIRIPRSRQRVQIGVARKKISATAGVPIRMQLRLSSRAVAAMDAVGGAMPVQIRIVAKGSSGSTSDDNGCVVLRSASARATAQC